MFVTPAKGRFSSVFRSILVAGLLIPLAFSGPVAAEEMPQSPASRLLPEHRAAPSTSPIITTPARIVRGVSISGTVSVLDPNSDTPTLLNGNQARVDLYNTQGYVSETQPNDSGLYTFTNLAPGTYYVKAVHFGTLPDGNEDWSLPRIAEGWYPDKPLLQLSTAITVTSTSVTGRNIVLAPAGQISGNLTNSNNQPVENAFVCAFAVSPVPTGEAPQKWCNSSDETGSYLIESLPRGDYKLKVDTSARQSTTVGGGWIGASGVVATYAAAATQTISSAGGLLSGRNAALGSRATISGQITFDGWYRCTVNRILTSCPRVYPLEGGVIEIYDDEGQLVNSAVVQANGNFTVQTIGPGNYYLSAGDPNQIYPVQQPYPQMFEGEQLLREFWTGKANLATATPITVNSTNLSGYNMRLDWRQIVVIGHVTYGRTNLEPDNVKVCLYSTATFEQTCEFTINGGYFSFYSVPIGEYRMYFDASGFEDPDEAGLGLRNAWWGPLGQPVKTYAEAFTITKAWTTSSAVSYVNMKLDVAPSISGNVDYRDYGGAQGATVEVYNSAGTYVGGTTTDESGNYTFVPDAPGTYKIYVDPGNVSDWVGYNPAPEWFSDSPDFGVATPITVGTANQTGKNFVLAPPATFAGKVSYLADGVTPVDVGGVKVCAYFSATLDPFACGISGSDGSYEITDLPNGNYKLKFDTTNAYDATHESLPLTTSWLGADTTLPVATFALATTQEINDYGDSGGEKNLQLPPGSLTTATPTISGTPTLGSTLTGNPGTWGPAPVSVTYEWRRGTTVVGTELTYVVQAADVGQLLTFRVTGAKALYSTTSATSGAVVGVYAWAQTPTPVVSGTPTFGNTLQVTPTNLGTWLPTPTSYSYQWKRNGSNITGATAASYVLAATDVGATISVAVSGVLTNYGSTPQTSSPTETIAAASFTATPVPTITGILNVGKVLTAATGTWTPTPTSFVYQWYRGNAPIGAATAASTYTLVAADIGQQIKVSATAVKSGYASPSPESLATSAIAPALFTTTQTPTISGTAKVGSTLTAASSAWVPAVDSYTYQWNRAGVAIVGDQAQRSTYVLVANDMGQRITVTVTGKKAGYTDTPKVSAATAAIVAGTFATAPVPTISGTLKVGETLTANEGSWSPTSDSYTYVWKWSATATGTYAAIGSATSKTYQLQSSDRGRFIKVFVTAVKAGYTSGVGTSAASASVVSDFTSAPTPTITGTAQVGKVLTAVPGSWSPVPAFSYVWKRNGVAIASATAATYTPVAADQGLPITVTVTGTLATYVTATRTSEATLAVTKGAFTTAPVPTITGTPIVGQSLGITVGTWAPLQDSFTYRWSVGGTLVAGTIGSGTTYVVQAADVGSAVTVTVTAKKAAYDDTPKTSLATAMVTLPLLATVPVPTFTPTTGLKVGATLTAKPLGTTATAPAGATVKGYQWSRAATATGVYTPITDATAGTYVLTAADVAKYLKLTVTWSKTGNADTPKLSAATMAVAAGTFTATATPTISGTAAVGSTLTANEGAWNPTPDSYTYKWVISATSGGAYSAIVGATGKTYLVQTTDRTKFLKVVVTAVKAGYTTSAAFTSTATAAIVQPAEGLRTRR
jgi:hypothetical protein